MIGHVEVYIDNLLLYRWEFRLNAPAALPWQMQQVIRETQYKEIIDRIHENVMPVFGLYPVTIFITYQSKLNENSEKATD